MSHIFISYNQADADFAAVVMMRLEKEGFDTWIDKGRLRPGADWSEEIDIGIVTALAMVLVISPDSRASEYVTYEWSFALGAGVHVVPLLLRDTEIHPRLRRLQYLDFRGNVRPWDELAQELASLQLEKTSHWTVPRNAPRYIHRAVLDMDSANSADRRGAIETLAGSGDEIARSALCHALTHSLQDVRALAAITLAELRDPTATTEIAMRNLKHALSCQEENFRLRAREAFKKIGGPAFEILADASRSAQDPSKYAALGLLYETGGKDAIDTLLSFVNSCDKHAIRLAMDQLRELRAQQAVQPIMRVMLAEGSADEDWDHDLRWLAAEALIAIGDSSIDSQIVVALKNPNPQVRMCAACVIGQVLGESRLSLIADLLDDNERAYFKLLTDNRHHTYSPGLIIRGFYTVHEVAAKVIDCFRSADGINILREYRSRHPLESRLGLRNDRLSID